MSLKLLVARWLAPDVFREADKHQHLRGVLEDAAMWLGYEFPEVDATIHWAKVSAVNHWRRLDEPSVATVPGKPWIWSISDFREHLRSARATALSSGAQSPEAEAQPSASTSVVEAPIPLSFKDKTNG